MRQDLLICLVRCSAFLIAFSIVGCSRDSEVVFERQNQAAATLARMTMAPEAHDPLRLDAIYAAEKRLKDACGPIRHVALGRMNGEPVSIGSEMNAIFALENCESETSRVERFIRHEFPDSARLNLK